MVIDSSKWTQWLLLYIVNLCIQSGVLGDPEMQINLWVSVSTRTCIVDDFIGIAKNQVSNITCVDQKKFELIIYFGINYMSTDKVSTGEQSTGILGWYNLFCSDFDSCSVTYFTCFDKHLYFHWYVIHVAIFQHGYHASLCEANRELW